MEEKLEKQLLIGTILGNRNFCLINKQQRNKSKEGFEALKLSEEFFYLLETN